MFLYHHILREIHCAQSVQRVLEESVYTCTSIGLLPGGLYRTIQYTINVFVYVYVGVVESIPCWT